MKQPIDPFELDDLPHGTAVEVVCGDDRETITMDRESMADAHFVCTRGGESAGWLRINNVPSYYGTRAEYFVYERENAEQTDG